ncbi:MAG: LCP family protein [Anaerolineales bacterium]|nr:LCP family protein [Anaerolineales bacterium]
MLKNKLINALLILSLIVPFMGTKSVSAAGNNNGICNGPDDVVNILVIGTDTRSVGYLYGLADTIMVFRVDFQNQTVNVIGFPRDLWVVIPDVEEDNGRTHGKLNQAYHFGTEGMGYYSGTGYGAGLMAATMEYNWGLEIDHYIVINMRTFRDVIDVLGGIEVYNPSPVYSFQQKNQPKVLAGGYFFSGQDALLYARYRDPRNVNDRVDRHAIIMKGIFKQIFSISTIPKIPEIIGLYKGNVLTDMHLAEISQFICLAAQMEFEEIQFGRIPKDILYIPDWEGFVWLENEPGTIEGILEDFQDGHYPYTPAEDN